jgi:hypothetical protein
VFLVRIARREETFSFLRVDPDSAYLSRFVEHYRDDIRRFMPDFVHDPDADRLCVFVLRDVVPAGLFVAERPTGEKMHVLLDYAIPDYRDLRIGRFLYRRLAGLVGATEPITLLAPAGTREHDRYFERIGYRRGDAGYVRTVD